MGLVPGLTEMSSTNEAPRSNLRGVCLMPTSSPDACADVPETNEFTSLVDERRYPMVTAGVPVSA